MAFYDLNKREREAVSLRIHQELLSLLQKRDLQLVHPSLTDDDTYIRKVAYIALGRIYFSEKELRTHLLNYLQAHSTFADAKMRQTIINAAGEIGMKEFEPIEQLMHLGLQDEHHSVRNAVIGSIKKMGQKNPQPTFAFARKFLHHPDKEIRREICHGIELRGRTHPQDILPMLKELQFDKTARVRNTLVHVLGQIAYKKGCLATVIKDLNTWENQELVKAALEEIIDVHHRYRNFAVLTQDEASAYIDANYKPVTR